MPQETEKLIADYLSGNIGKTDATDFTPFAS